MWEVGLGNYMVWVGGVHAGLRLKLRGNSAAFDSPLHRLSEDDLRATPWHNTGRGYAELRADAALVASSGDLDLAPTEARTSRLEILQPLTTPTLCPLVHPLLHLSLPSPHPCSPPPRRAPFASSYFSRRAAPPTQPHAGGTATSRHACAWSYIHIDMLPLPSSRELYAYVYVCVYMYIHTYVYVYAYTARTCHIHI